MSNKEIEETIRELFKQKQNSYHISLTTGIPQKQVYHYIETFEKEKRAKKAEYHKRMEALSYA